jgi:hypothetical protein
VIWSDPLSRRNRADDVDAPPRRLSPLRPVREVGVALRVRRAEMTGDVAALVGGWAGRRTFCQPGFADLWREKGGRPVVWMAEHGGEPLAVLPGVEFGRRPFLRFQSMPDGGYGGVLWSSDVAAADRANVVDELLAAVVRAGYVKTFICDFYHSLAGADGFRQTLAATRLVDITSPVWEPPDRKLLAQVHKAEREGIRVVDFDWPIHAEGFLALVRLTEHRHGRRRPFYGDGFYRRLADYARTGGRVRWLMCEHDGRPACSHIYLLEDDMLQGWQFVFDKAFSFLKPNQYMELWMCQHMVEAGIQRLNLGGSPQDAYGLRAFKDRWGGSAVAYPVWVRRSGLGRLR